MNKYRHVFAMGLQGTLVYRWNFLIRAAFSLISLAVVVILWSAAYRGEGLIGGFTLEQTISYFLLITFANFVVAANNEDYQIAEEIRNGLINQFLLKPINYFAYRLTLFFAARLVSAFLAMIPLLVVYPLIADYLQLPNEAWRWAVAVPALFMAALLQFSIAYCYGLLAFWFLEIAGFVVLSLAVESLLSGQIFPLDLLPEPLFRLSQLLPFYYQMYFPVAVLSGRLDQAQAIEGLFIQAVWVLLFIGIAALLWRRGLRRHTAVGG
jgi:ABC-2 type transport system permease protein